jgi:hypothetical protein
MDISSRRTTGVAGIVFVALAIAILGGDADFSRDDAALQDFFVNDTRQAQAVTAVVLLPLAAAALLGFVAGIHTLLRAGDAGGGMLPSAAALGGSVFAATFLVGITTSNSVTAALAFTDAYQFDAGIARLTLILGIILTAASLAGAAVLVVATSLASQRSGLLPTWFSPSGYVVAVLALFSVLLFAWPIALVGLWMLSSASCCCAGRRPSGPRSLRCGARTRRARIARPARRSTLPLNVGTRRPDMAAIRAPADRKPIPLRGAPDDRRGARFTCRPDRGIGCGPTPHRGLMSAPIAAALAH